MYHLNHVAMYGNHFTFKELIHTDTGLDNSVSCDSDLINLAALWNTLNLIRERLGKPIYINSAYRSLAVNKRVGGAKRSLHLQGRAADIRCARKHMERLWQIIEQYDSECGLSEKIKYSTFYHIAI